MLDLILTQTLNGLASASSLFLVASGLSIIFGVTRIVNFAHGSLYMLGAYLAVTLVTAFGPASAFGFWGGVALAYNVRSPEEVDAVLDEAERAGATVTRRGEPTSWGGYTGIFLDPDGHPWEVAHNPDWTLREDGSVEVR